jgi:hypothetical protein
MNSFRAYWREAAEDAITAGPRLHVASRIAPPRPRWRHLYLGLGTVGVIGTAAHLLVNGPVLVRVVNLAFTFALFVVFTGWVHANQQALTRLGEPDAGSGRPRVRIVRSRRHPAEEAPGDGVVRLDPGDRVVLPYDPR